MKILKVSLVKRGGLGIMAIKTLYRNILLSIGILITNLSFTQPVEQQIKLKVKNQSSFESFLINNSKIESYQMVTHSNVTYYDLYFDDRGHVLAKNGYSLRFRQRINELDTSYVFQLKSEMEGFDGVRLEVDQADLHIYTVQNRNGSINLEQLLTQIFSSDSLNHEDVDLLTTWMEKKYGAPIGPFQYLRHLEKRLNNFNLGQLIPVLVGRSERLRSHVVLNGDGTTFYNRQAKKDLPNYFKENANALWIVETSFDESCFIGYNMNLNPIGTYCLVDFEVERKYEQLHEFDYLKDFVSRLMKRYDLEIESKSKYLQSLIGLNVSIQQD